MTDSLTPVIVDATNNQITRGMTVFFAAQFNDQYGNAVEPPFVNVSVDYYLNGQRTSATYPMVWNVSAAAYQYAWDSNIAGPGNVYWAVQTPEPQPTWAGQGFFILKANAANQGPP
jgi:hypothetical protein